jgi:hypothetical protein
MVLAALANALQIVEGAEMYAMGSGPPKEPFGLRILAI